MAERELYVGYLPVPPGVRRVLRWVVPGVLWLLVGVAWVWARGQWPAGEGVWEDGRVREFRGVLKAAPYAMLVAGDRGDGQAGTLMIVEMGKRGGGARAERVLAAAGAKAGEGRRAVVNGYVLRRDGRWMIELEDGEGAVKVESGAAGDEAGPAKGAGGARGEGVVHGDAVVRGERVVRGEVVDWKCYLGAMKPGEGRPHKECAVLCVSGGIPPVLVERRADGTRGYHVLTERDGGALGSWAWPMVGDAVEVRGEVEERDGLSVMKVEEMRRV